MLILLFTSIQQNVSLWMFFGLGISIHRSDTICDSTGEHTATKAQPQTDVQTPTQFQRISPCPFSAVIPCSPLPAFDHVIMPGGPAEVPEKPFSWVCSILSRCPSQQRVPAPASPLQRRQSLPCAHCHMCYRSQPHGHSNTFSLFPMAIPEIWSFDTIPLCVTSPYPFSPSLPLFQYRTLFSLFDLSLKVGFIQMKPIPDTRHLQTHCLALSLSL